MADLPVQGLTVGHLAHHEALHAVAGGDTTIAAGEQGHAAAHAALKTWAAGEGTSVADYNGYGAGHDIIHQQLHAAYNAATSATAAPSGNLPGWTLVLSEDFTTPAAVGQFATVYGADMAGYDGFEDTSRDLGRPVGQRGVYSPDIALSAHDSLMDMYLHHDGTSFRCAAPAPDGWVGQTYGRYAARFMVTGTENLEGYKTAWLLWPDSDVWAEGEIDFPEGDLNSTIGGFSHEVDGNPANNVLSVSTSETYGQWHIAVIEWEPSILRFILDDVLVGSTTNPAGIPQTPMHWVLQTETWLSATAPPTASEGHVLVDWVAQWTYTP